MWLWLSLTIYSLDSSIQAAELDYKLALEETGLVALQQDQARLFTKLELALADHHVAVEKVIMIQMLVTVPESKFSHLFNSIM